MSLARPTFCFVVPALDGPISGGTLYNRGLSIALGEHACEVVVCTREDARLGSLLDAADYSFVDTLYLDALPELAQRARRAPLLLVHYLPALVAAGRAVSKAELSPPEARALVAAGGFLVTSAFMREALSPLVATQRTIVTVEPGSIAELRGSVARSPSPLRALVIANLLPGKGVARLLEALSAALRSSDRLELRVVGRLDADPAYSARCARLIAQSSGLRARVTLCGALGHEQTLAALAAADVLLSASRMESYGMALADARIMGVPILACAGGNVASHVDVAAGAQLVADAEALAAALLELARDPWRLAAREADARRLAPAARSWGRAARELLDQLAGLEK